MTYRPFAALAAASVLAACASGPRPPGMAGGAGVIAEPIALAFTDFDADRDRRITRDEMAAGLEASWRALDANGDGEGSPLEFADWLRAHLGASGATPGRVAFDRDVSGAVSRSEFAMRFEAEFERLDADGDGVLVRSELVRTVESRLLMRGEERLEDRPGGRDPRQPGG